jgi:hypothetical protein
MRFPIQFTNKSMEMEAAWEAQILRGVVKKEVVKKKKPLKEANAVKKEPMKRKKALVRDRRVTDAVDAALILESLARV